MKSATKASKQCGSAEISTNDYRISSELVKERIRANFKSLNEQISNLNQLLNQLIQDNSTKTIPTAGSGTDRQSSGSFLTRLAWNLKNLV